MIKDEKKKWLNVLIWLISVVSMIGLMILGSRFLNEDNVGLLIEFTVITAVSLLFLYLISGKKTFSFLNNQTGYTVKMLFPTLFFSIVFGLFGTIAAIMDRPALIENWPVNLLIGAVNMFLVGIYEETCFRACACDALLPVLKKTKHPFLLTVLISSLVFGYVHVVNTDFSNLQKVLQFFLKITNVAISGVTFMILYWKTRNLLGLAIVHGLNDFLPDVLNYVFVFKDVDNSDSYVSGDIGTTIVYLVQLAVVIACLVYVYKKVAGTIDYPKTLEEW
ncbi:MAG: CPBP family intramembrane metalloprotease [Erysipelotrichaceae bacterium]|nr:CPBP family intramembrane metalloprotease [Erysipelotrichaceae bacterium]